MHKSCHGVSGVTYNYILSTFIYRLSVIDKFGHPFMTNLVSLAPWIERYLRAATAVLESDESFSKTSV